ncbi:MAG: DUF5063 domain-containing protein [Bacteroidales bacterium]|nr:DUF5063 domain-containing protein [Bacteroidales bacterium]
MKNKLHQLVYSRNVIEFLTVANEFCRIIEGAEEDNVRNSLDKLHKILPLLYLKAALLPENEIVLDDDIDKHVTEFDYNLYNQKWLQVLGENDSFYEVFDPSIQFGQETVTASISENLADIYQPVKNFVFSYSIGNDEVMNDALYECRYGFEEYWGQNLVNVLRAIHRLVYGSAGV